MHPVSPPDAAPATVVTKTCVRCDGAPARLCAACARASSLDLIRDLQARVAQLVAENTQLLGSVDRAQVLLLESQIAGRRRRTPGVPAGTVQS